MAYNEMITSVITSADGTLSPGTVSVPILIAPFGGITIQSAYIAAADAVAANGSNYVTATLIDAGAAGTATTAIGTAGGTTGVTVAPAAYTLNSALLELDAGDYLTAKLVKTGTVADNGYSIIIKWVHGQG